ncbi:hypothetical protein [Streptomyces sp. NBC_01435]|uniref:hypothetical protein n=1 Tax=Streptomyces sp. NBC_01435 TaxID=2903865 RepID=UPI002E2EE223|nr:hypothetical protein [Streptomyces sp. NBC_01435]
MKTDDEKLGYKPQVREVEAAEQEVNDISSRLLDAMNVKGKTGGSGAMIGQCEAVDPDMEKYYTVAHPWSIYDLEEGTFEAAMQNLRDQLPKMGWKITKDGETKSIAKNPEIVAVDTKSHHTVTIEWAKNRSGDLKQLISIDVGSRCYRAPEGTDLSTAH